MTIEVQAKVAEVLSSREVALNVGIKSGVQLDSRVVIWRTIQVRDPDTKERLGEVKLEKLHLRVREVSDRFCIAITLPRTTFNGGGWFHGGAATIRMASGSKGDDAVLVEVGDPATIIVAQASDEPDGEGSD